MEKHITYSIQECSLRYEVDESFILDLQELGLLTFAGTTPTPQLEEESLALLEKYARMHYDMDINLPGIEVIAHLLRQINELNSHISVLQNRVVITDFSDAVDIPIND